MSRKIDVTLYFNDCCPGQIKMLFRYDSDTGTHKLSFQATYDEFTGKVYVKDYFGKSISRKAIHLKKSNQSYFVIAGDKFYFEREA
jgi:hypothetical protein